MRILILNSILYTAENNTLPKVESIKDCMIYNFALGFVQMNHEVTLIAAEDYKPVLPEEYDFDIVFLKSNLKQLFKVNLLPLHISLWSFLKKRKNDFDLIISSESFSLNTLFASLISPTKLIIWQEMIKHNNIYHKIPSKVWHNIIVRFLYRKTLIIPRSEKAYLFISKYAKKVSKEYIEHGIDFEKHNYDEKEKKEQFVVVSQLIERKRIDRIIDNFSKFVKNAKQYSQYKLLIIGRGDMESSLKKLSQNLNMETNIIFKGFLPHEKFFPIVAESKALLVDTRKDLNMVTIAESVALRTPVLTNSEPSSSYYIKNNRLGIVEDDWNEIDLIQIIENNSEYVSNCVNYRAKLSNKNIAKEFIEVFIQNKKDA